MPINVDSTGSFCKQTKETLAGYKNNTQEVELVQFRQIVVHLSGKSVLVESDIDQVFNCYISYIIRLIFVALLFLTNLVFLLNLLAFKDQDALTC